MASSYGSKAGAEMAKHLCDSLNAMGYEDEWVQGFAAEFHRQHRTLQQNAVRALVRGLVTWAKDAKAERRYDLRNEAAMNMMADFDIRAMPFV